MMFILSLIPATFFVALGYFIMQSAGSAEGGTQKFGKYLSVWVFVLAALIVLGGAVGSFSGMQRMRGEDGMSRMQGMREMRERQIELLERLVEAQEGASEAIEETPEFASKDDVDEGTESAIVGISHNAFQPAALFIAIGETVRFHNFVNMPGGHTVVADDGSFSSGSLAENEVWEQTFNELGTYEFHIEQHSTVKGSITVGE